MTFDQFANQGDTGAWDPESKKAADKIFGTADEGETESTEPAEDPSGEGDSGGGEKQDPHPPSQVPDPDLAVDN